MCIWLQPQLPGNLLRPGHRSFQRSSGTEKGQQLGGAHMPGSLVSGWNRLQQRPRKASWRRGPGAALAGRLRGGRHQPWWTEQTALPGGEELEGSLDIF